MTTTLLPSNLPKEERMVESVEQRLTDLQQNVQIEHLWHPWRCPVDFLPVLAWSVSVDVWDEDWPEQTKRQVIAASPYLHEIKGTPLAVKLALGSISLDYEYREWHEFNPPKERGTFDIDVYVSDQGITPALVDNAHNLVKANKRGTAKYNLTLNLASGSTLYSASAVQLFADIEIGIYQPPSPTFSMVQFTASAVQLLATVEVNPI